MHYMSLLISGTVTPLGVVPGLMLMPYPVFAVVLFAVITTVKLRVVVFVRMVIPATVVGE